MKAYSYAKRWVDLAMPVVYFQRFTRFAHRRDVVTQVVRLALAGRALSVTSGARNNPLAIHVDPSILARMPDTHRVRSVVCTANDPDLCF